MAKIKIDTKKLKKIAQPTFIKPMLATLTKNYFSSNDWIYEEKFDGVRCLAFKKKGKIRLISRNNHSMNTSYPEIVETLAKEKADNFIIDGEIVAMQKNVSSFQLLQSRMNLKNLSEIENLISKIPITFCVFDILYLDGYDLRPLPLLERKKILKSTLNFNKFLLYTDHVVGNGVAEFKRACKRHWEGLIAKKIDSTYVSVRSKNWLKFKCLMEQELVIGGYTNPSGSRKHFGALIVGYYENGKLKYAGKVGTGFSYQILKDLGTKLQKIETAKCPFFNYNYSSKNVHWVKPKLVGEFKFAEWTKDNRLRVGRYLGLRNDKDAKEVVKEVAK